MPMHMPKFEHVSALKHHCGVCNTPFSNPSALSTCIGKHEVICANFHFLFHFIGKAHTCKACTKAEDQQHKRHRAILLLVQDYEGANRTTVEQPQSPCTPTPEYSLLGEKIKKKDKKALKKSTKAFSTFQIVKQSDFDSLEAIMYPSIASTQDNEELAEVLAQKVLPVAFSDRKLMEKLMAPPEDKPNLELEASRVAGLLGIFDPCTKAARAVLERIKLAIQEDIEIHWNSDVEMRRRRIIYAQWVTNGAVEKMATHYQDWDINTGARTIRRFKGDPKPASPSTAEGTEETADEADASSIGTARTRINSFDDVGTGSSTVFGDDSTETVQKRGVATPQMRDDRRGGKILNPSSVPSPSSSPFASSFAALATPDTEPGTPLNTPVAMLKIVPPQKRSPWKTLEKAERYDLAVKSCATPVSARAAGRACHAKPTRTGLWYEDRGHDAQDSSPGEQMGHLELRDRGERGDQQPSLGTKEAWGEEPADTAAAAGPGFRMLRVLPVEAEEIGPEEGGGWEFVVKKGRKARKGAGCA